MSFQPASSERPRIVLVGAGHAHVEVVRRLGTRGAAGGARGGALPAGAEVVLVSPKDAATYSGMAPGVVAGLYAPQDARIDLPALVGRFGARFIRASACGLDRVGKRLHLSDGSSLPYDLLSLDVGIAPDTSAIEGGDVHGWPVKPMSSFLGRVEKLLESLTERQGPQPMVIIGGGVGGVELALAFAARMRRAARTDCAFTLVSGGVLLPDRAGALRRRLAGHLHAAGVDVVENDPAVRIEADVVRLRSGRALPHDVAIVATGAAAPSWLAGTGLALEGAGFLAVGPTLQCLGETDVFAAGDCASLLETPRPKAGVFAVRAGPPLARNIAARAMGRGLIAWRPQKNHLALISLGDKRAVATWGPFAAEGAWAWRWKDWIDRRWMARYRA